MKPHLYLLLLAVGISAAAPIGSSIIELLTLLDQMVLVEDLQSLRIETPDDIHDENCVSTIFEGSRRLRQVPAMTHFSDFFKKLEALEPSLTPALAHEGPCETERRTAAIFLEELRKFIQKSS